MEKRNRDIEDFFNNSMDQFDQQPSGEVWESIDYRLSQMPTGWSKYLAVLRKYLPLALVLSLATFIYFKQESKITELHNELVNLKSESHYTSNVNKLISNSELSQIPELTNGEQALDLEEQTKSRQNVEHEMKVNLPFHKDKYFHSTSIVSDIKKTKPSNSSQEQQLIEGVLEPQNALKPVDVIGVSETLNSFSLIRTESVVMGEEQNATDIIKFSDTAPLVSYIPAIQSNSRQIVSNKIQSASSLASGHLVVSEAPMIELRQAPFYKHKIGMSTRIFNLFTNYSKDFNGCRSYGLRYEYGLNQNLHLTSAMHFNIQHYDITAKRNEALEGGVLKQYSDLPLESYSINQIDANSEYFDFMLGFKYDFKTKVESYKFFVNPSINWQLYLPQTFAFSAADQLFYRRDDRRMIGYMGSATVGLGVESVLWEKIIVQFSLWGEKSFIPLGIQSEKVSMVGISTALFFGI